MNFLKNVTDCHNFFLLGLEIEGYSGVREGAARGHYASQDTPLPPTNIITICQKSKFFFIFSQFAPKSL
mgnify:FL=1